MADISRNAPCPCGSGKKYKNCHLGKEQELAVARSFRGPVLALLSALAVAAGVLAYFSKGPSAGLAVGLGGLMLVAIAAAVIKPPPPGKGGDPGAINFGS